MWTLPTTKDYTHFQLNESIKQMKNAGLPIAPSVWHISFGRQTSVPMEAGEWEEWLQAMDLGIDEVENGQLSKLRCTASAEAVQSLFNGVPDRRELCQDAWRAVVDLINKITGAAWFATTDQAFQDELRGVALLTRVGFDMHHSTSEQQDAADAFKKKLQAGTKATMYFYKLLSQTCAGVQLNAAVCEVLAAREKVSGWIADLESSFETFRALPQLLEDHFLSKDFDIVVPSGAKVAEIQSKVGALLQSSTDKFQEDYKGKFDMLQKFQLEVAMKIKRGLARRVFCKVPSLSEAVAWCMKGCGRNSNAQVDGHKAAITAAKTAVTSRTQLGKYVGCEIAKSLGEFTSNMAKFLSAMYDFALWREDVDKDSTGSLSVFRLEPFLDWTKYFLIDESPIKDQTGEIAAFRFVDLHADCVQWSKDFNDWLSNFVRDRVTTKLASCESFVGMLVNQSDSKEICNQSITGAVDAEEELGALQSQFREMSTIACALCVDAASKENFAFGDIQIDLQTLCASAIFLPCARYTAGLLDVTEQLAKFSLALTVQSQDVESLKVPGKTRTECASDLLVMTKRWIQAGNAKDFL